MKFTLALLSLLFVFASCTTHAPITATSNKIGHVKGEACSRNILFIFPLSRNESIHEAAKDAGISEISTVDREFFTSIIYNTRCTVVHGNK